MLYNISTISLISFITYIFKATILMIPTFSPPKDLLLLTPLSWPWMPFSCLVVCLISKSVYQTFYMRLVESKTNNFYLQKDVGFLFCQSTGGGMTGLPGSEFCCCFDSVHHWLQYFEGEITSCLSTGTEIWSLTILQRSVFASEPIHQLSELLKVSPYVTTQL